MIDWEFIEAQEGFETAGYVPMAGGTPLGRSGVTIGAGVDLGQWSEAQLRRRRVPQNIIDQVKPYLGVRGWLAVQLLEQKPLMLTEAEARRLTQTIRGDIVDLVIKRYEAEARRQGSLRWDALLDRCQTIIVSVAFQYGAFLSKRTPNFHHQITTGRWRDAYENLMNFGDDYPSRRQREAEHLKPVLGSRLITNSRR